MFWGLVLEPGKRYSTTVEKSFHVSKAVLDCSSVKSEAEILSVILETEGSESLLCNLCKHKGILQETLDLNFMTGDRLTFECRGHGRVHLSGYLLPDDDDDISGMMGDEDESEEEEESGWTAGDASPETTKKEKRKSNQPPDNPSKKKKVVADDEEDGDSDEDNDSELSDDLEDEDMEDDEEDGEDGDEDEDDDESDEEEESTDEKQKKNKNKTPNKQQQASPKKTPLTNGVTPKDQKSNKKSPGGGMTPNANATPKQKQVLEGGVVIKEIKAGNGPVAKPGKTVAVYYIGKFKENQKVFDKQTKGEGFTFKLGKGDVIKGWDIGVQGMKVGGKRLIHCPPGVAYGAKGAPPKIPPNSSLMFEVELRKVN